MTGGLNVQGDVNCVLQSVTSQSPDSLNEVAEQRSEISASIGAAFAQASVGAPRAEEEGVRALWSGSGFPVIESLPSADLALPLAFARTDKEALAEWLESAKLGGIETVQDLRARAWPVATDAVILGVFRAGEAQASWLVVGQEDGWAVASCDRNQVIGTSDTLGGALALILPAGGAAAIAAPPRALA